VVLTDSVHIARDIGDQARYLSSRKGEMRSTCLALTRLVRVIPGRRAGSSHYRWDCTPGMVTLDLCLPGLRSVALSHACLLIAHPYKPCSSLCLDRESCGFKLRSYYLSMHGVFWVALLAPLHHVSECLMTPNLTTKHTYTLVCGLFEMCIDMLAISCTY